MEALVVARAIRLTRRCCGPCIVVAFSAGLLVQLSRGDGQERSNYCKSVAGFSDCNSKFDIPFHNAN